MRWGKTLDVQCPRQRDRGEVKGRLLILAVHFMLGWLCSRPCFKGLVNSTLRPAGKINDFNKSATFSCDVSRIVLYWTNPNLAVITSPELVTVLLERNEWGTLCVCLCVFVDDEVISFPQRPKLRTWCMILFPFSWAPVGTTGERFELFSWQWFQKIIWPHYERPHLGLFLRQAHEVKHLTTANPICTTRFCWTSFPQLEQKRIA